MYIYLRKFKIFYFLLFLLFSIKTSAYLIPEEEVREIETIDHEICLSKGVELTDNYSRRMYWQCRLNLNLLFSLHPEDNTILKPAPE